MPNIDSTLFDMDCKNLYRLADFYDKQATICRARAQVIQKDISREERMASRLEYLQKTPLTVARYLRSGHSLEHAIKLAVEHTGVLEETIRSYWKKFITSNEKVAVRERNNLIVHLNRIGIKNVDIAERLNLHHVTISRILSKRRRESLYTDKNPYRIAFFHRDEKVNENTNIRAFSNSH